MRNHWAAWHREIISGQRRGLCASFLRFGLWLVSVPYAAVMRVRNVLHDRGWKRCHRAGVPVISVGNLTLGGTGKTPAVEWLACFCRERERRVAVLSRGYGQSEGRNDEALVLEENLPDVPHLQGKDRVSLARTAVEELESELLLLDDGFQHRRLHRDMDIVLIDATEPWGYGWVFPRGLLREPRGRLRQAGIIALTRSNQVSAEVRERLRQEVARLAPACRIVESIHAPAALRDAEGREEPLERLRNQSVAAFCGIGNPAAFFQTLQQLGTTILDRRTYDDHYAYRREDVNELIRWADMLPAETWIVTTQKDLVKLRLTRLGDKPLRAVRIAWQITKGERELVAAIERVLA